MKRGSGMAMRMAVFVAGAWLLAPTAAAYEAGDWRVRLGPTSVHPIDDSGSVRVNGSPVDGTGVGVDSDLALGFTVTYMITSRLGIELLGSTPFKHEIDGEGLGIDEIGDVRHLPPTLSFQYFPAASHGRFQPYLGVGVNYILAYDADSSSELEAAFGDARIDVNDSIGFAAQVGADYHVTERTKPVNSSATPQSPCVPRLQGARAQA